VLGQYLPLFGLFVLAALFAAGSLMVSGLLAPRRSTLPKLAPYECGIMPARDTPEQFPVRFFLVAMIFIVFDVEIVVFYPYAVARGGLGLFGLVVLLVFTFAVFESFVYLIGAGALEWGPSPQTRSVAAASPGELEAVAATATVGDAGGVAHKAVSPDAMTTSAPMSASSGEGEGDAPEMVSAARTARNTVRRVGLEGRGW